MEEAVFCFPSYTFARPPETVIRATAHSGNLPANQLCSCIVFFYSQNLRNRKISLRSHFAWPIENFFAAHKDVAAGCLSEIPKSVLAAANPPRDPCTGRDKTARGHGWCGVTQCCSQRVCSVSQCDAIFLFATINNRGPFFFCSQPLSAKRTSQGKPHSCWQKKVFYFCMQVAELKNKKKKLRTRICAGQGEEFFFKKKKNNQFKIYHIVQGISIGKKKYQ